MMSKEQRDNVLAIVREQVKNTDSVKLDRLMSVIVAFKHSSGYISELDEMWLAEAEAELQRRGYGVDYDGDGFWDFPRGGE